VPWAGVSPGSAGRARPGDPVSAQAGLEAHVAVGAEVRAGQPLYTLFSDDAQRLPAAERIVVRAVVLADAPPRPVPLVHEVLSRDTLSQTAAAEV
jgi:pyrimidine-nucleoside phosphorylase